MGTKTKRTYNISPEAVATVKRLVEERHLAPSQDALVERAIIEFARRVRDADDARMWQAARDDAEFQAEVEQIGAEFFADDDRAWES
jgi:ABC-type taurine transport system ATPase subunit